MAHNPYQPTLTHATPRTRSYSVLWFAIATCFGLNSYLAMDIGLQFAVSSFRSDPVGWLGPTFVFAIASFPLAMLCKFTIWKPSSIDGVFFLPAFGGLVFGYLALTIDRWIDNGLTVMGQGSNGMGRTAQFVASMVLTGMLSISAQYVYTSVWKCPFQSTRFDEPESR